MPRLDETGKKKKKKHPNPEGCRLQIVTDDLRENEVLGEISFVFFFFCEAGEVWR